MDEREESGALGGAVSKVCASVCQFPVCTRAIWHHHDGEIMCVMGRGGCMYES